MNSIHLPLALDAVVHAQRVHRAAVIRLGASRAAMDPAFIGAARASHGLSNAAVRDVGAEAFTAALMLRLEAEQKAIA